MRTVSAAMQTVLASGSALVVADLYTFTLTNGTVLRWTSSQQPLTIGANTFVLGAPIDRDKASWRLGLNVDSLGLTIYDDGNTLIDGQPLVVAAWKNLLDLAAVQIDRFISDSWTNLAPGAVNIFTGVVGDVQIKGKQIKITVESSLAVLKATFPRTYILPACTNTLYDSICGMLAANFTFNGTVGANPTATSFPLGVTQPDGYFQQGKVTFTNGANAGQTRTVKSYVGGVITLLYPLYTAPAVGDGVTAVAGCDKTRATCTARFNNIIHFRGFPYVPDPSTQYTGAAQKGGGTSSGGSGSTGLARGGSGAGGYKQF